LKPSGKKATWFRDLETKIISEPLTRKIQQELIKVGKNLYAAKISIQPRNDDKENSIQEGPKLKRCQSCNDEQKEQSRGCLFQRNFKSNKKAIDKKLIKKIKKELAISYLVIEPLEKRILKECIKNKEVIDELLTITRKL
ncbi:10016_t:CDS:2, partial [Gigaspora margarita]